MKKQKKSQQTPKKKKKQPLTFEQRFRDKKNIVSKLGVLDLLGFHQPFHIDRQMLNNEQEVHQLLKSKVREQKQQQISRRKMSESQKQKQKSKEDNFRSHKTQKILNATKNSGKKKLNELPKISKSLVNIQMDLYGRQQISTREYWKGKMEVPIITKRANSQLSCINILKEDCDANNHWKNLVKFQRLNNYRRRSLKFKDQ